MKLLDAPIPHAARWAMLKRTAANPSEPQRRRLRRPAAAAYIGVATATLDKWATERRGPPFKKAGGRVVVYDTADLDAFLAECETGGGQKALSSCPASSRQQVKVEGALSA